MSGVEDDLKKKMIKEIISGMMKSMFRKRLAEHPTLPLEFYFVVNCVLNIDRNLFFFWSARDETATNIDCIAR